MSNPTLCHVVLCSGCGCVATQHKCCPDNLTPAEGPGYSGCPCHTFEYGCCPDGKSVARGPGQVNKLPKNKIAKK